ncbi:MAG: DNA polymerase IV [Planctomycetota bacterium]
MQGQRKVIHVDMDAFFASVEELDLPELRGQPVIVGGSGGPRGVVSSASYEARRYGIASAMPLAQAKRLCPKGVFLPVRISRYAEVSRRIAEILEGYTPLVEPVSLDEAYLDVTGCERLFGDAAMIGREIQQRIRDEVELSASVGVGPNKFLAKLASDLDKPGGFVVVTLEGTAQFLASLPVERILGVGKVGKKQLNDLGVWTIADVERVGARALAAKFGKWGQTLWELAHGRDDSEVVPDWEAKSIGRETTFEEDLTDWESLAEMTTELVEDVGRRLRREALKAKRLEVKVRWTDFQTTSRTKTLPEPTSSDRVLTEAALGSLAEKWGRGGRAVRLVGVSASGLVKAQFEQPSLFPDEGRAARGRLEVTMDRIRDRFGADAIRRGRRSGEGPKRPE